jgi:pimeloyl-ACP methyl ester carboxylesterase
MSVVAGVRMPGECVAIITEAGQSFTEAGTMDGLRQADENFRDPEQFARLARYHGEKAQWVLDSWVKTWLSPAFANWTLAPELEKLRVPLLALHGDQDEYGSTEHARRLVEGRPEERRMAILKGCGHVPHRDNPELVLDEVAAFLAAMP